MNAIASLAVARIDLNLLAASFLALASTACSAGIVEPPRAPPSVAGVAAAGDGACHATGPAVVLATRVFVPGGVEATASGEGFAVRFRTRASRCVAVDWPSASDPGGPHPVSCPAPGVRTATRESAGSQAMLALKSHEEPEPRGSLGALTSDAPGDLFGSGIEPNPYGAQHTFRAPAARPGDFATTPELAPIGHDRFLLAWVEGSVEEHHLSARSVVGWGDPQGPGMVLSPPDASVIGRPSVAVAPTGQGLVTYIASVDGKFEVLGTPVACAMD
jgi:hypothetical protein